MIKNLFNEIKDNLDESAWIKIKFNALMSVLSFVFIVIGVCACTISGYFSLVSLAPLVVFGVIMAILGLIGLICFVIGISEIVHST